jgi:hypothetical protein
MLPCRTTLLKGKKPGSPEGGTIVHMVYHNVKQMQMPFVERNTEGDVLLAIVPTVLARIEMGKEHNVKDLVDSMAVQATFKKGPIDSDSSGSSSDTNGTGHYLHCFDKSHVERGESVKNLLMKGTHTLDKTVGKFATAFKCVYKGSIMNEYDKSIERRFPSTDDIWESTNTVGLAAGIKKASFLHLMDASFIHCHHLVSATTVNRTMT